MEFKRKEGGCWGASRKQIFRVAPCMGKEDGVVKPCLGSGWRLRSAWIVELVASTFGGTQLWVGAGRFASVVIAEVKSTATSRRRMSPVHGRTLWSTTWMSSYLHGHLRIKPSTLLRTYVRGTGLLPTVSRVVARILLRVVHRQGKRTKAIGLLSYDMC